MKVDRRLISSNWSVGSHTHVAAAQERKDRDSSSLLNYSRWSRIHFQFLRSLHLAIHSAHV